MKNLTEQNPHKSATSEQLDVTPEDNKKKKIVNMKIMRKIY